MHKYLRSIGFRGIDNDDYRMLIHDIVAHPDEQFISEENLGDEIIEYRKDYALNLGISITGYLDENDGFVREYVHPYFMPSLVSANEEIKLEKFSDKDCYYGIVEDNRIGIDLVFFIQDNPETFRNEFEGNKIIQKGPVRLGGLSDNGMVILPLSIEKKPEINEIELEKKKELYENARNGDIDAMEELSNRDMDMYSVISERIKSEDTMTIVSSYIMPIGFECDQYNVLGEIKDHNIYVNSATRQKVHVMTLECSGIILEVCINDKDLQGEIKVGRRFKGDIWLQGRIF